MSKYFWRKYTCCGHEWDRLSEHSDPMDSCESCGKEQEDCVAYVNRAPMASTFESFESPIDGSVISSTAQLRDHEKKHNVKQVGNDYATSMEKRKEQFEARKRESKEQEKDFLYTDINNPTKDIGDHYGKPSSQ